jgi:hypothetical protein
MIPRNILDRYEKLQSTLPPQSFSAPVEEEMEEEEEFPESGTLPMESPMSFHNLPPSKEPETFAMSQTLNTEGPNGSIYEAKKETCVFCGASFAKLQQHMTLHHAYSWDDILHPERPDSQNDEMKLDGMRRPMKAYMIPYWAAQRQSGDSLELPQWVRAALRLIPREKGKTAKKLPQPGTIIDELPSADLEAFIPLNHRGSHATSRAEPSASTPKKRKAQDEVQGDGQNGKKKQKSTQSEVVAAESSVSFSVEEDAGPSLSEAADFLLGMLVKECTVRKHAKNDGWTLPTYVSSRLSMPVAREVLAAAASHASEPRFVADLGDKITFFWKGVFRS